MQIARELGYWEKKPAIILKASVPRSANKDKRYVILFDHIWQYTEDFYEPLDATMPKTFEGFMMAKALDLYELFDLGTPNSRQLAEVAWLIQDSIDQLKDMPPYHKQKKVVGEATMEIDGTRVEAEISE
jgi:hypothetical protein